MREFADILKAHGIAISMDGRAGTGNIFEERLWRSVKHEDVYLKGYATMSELLIGLTEYLCFTTRNDRTKPWATAHRIRYTERRAGAEQELWTNTVSQKKTA